MRHLILAFQFLTVIPIRTRAEIREQDIPRSAAFFVLVGLAQGLLLVITDQIASLLFHPDLVTALILLVYVLTEGGFNLDGLADTFDGLAIKSSGDVSRDRERRLAVMRDSTTGPAGITALIFTLGLKYLAIKHLAHFAVFTYYSSLLLMPVLSKWTMVFLMRWGRPARQDGLAFTFMKGISNREPVISTAILLLLFLLPAFLIRGYVPENYVLSSFIILLLSGIYCLFWIRLSSRKLGGITGDVCGAVSETVEVYFLLLVIAWSRLSI